MSRRKEWWISEETNIDLFLEIFLDSIDRIADCYGRHGRVETSAGK